MSGGILDTGGNRGTVQNMSNGGGDTMRMFTKTTQGLYVSTVLLHEVYGPDVWETMVFDAEDNEFDAVRSSGHASAATSHEALVARYGGAA